MATMSLHQYYNRIVWVNLTVYIAYFIIKYFSGIGLGVMTVIRKCRKTSSQSESTNNANRRPSLPWLILVVFGKQLGLKDASKTHKLFIKDTAILSRCGQITVFYIIILGSVVLALGSALDLSLFSVTRICTEDPNIDCYPQLINASVDLMDFYISTVPIDKPIQDCSTVWNSVGISSRVTFLCFQRFFNFEYFLAVSGGLLAFAFIILKASIGCLLRTTHYCMIALEAKYMLVIRFIFIAFAEVVNIGMAILCLVLGVTTVTPDSINDDPGTVFLAMNSVEILVIIGTVATLLWLPWEEYIKHQKNTVPPTAHFNLTQNDFVQDTKVKSAV